MGLSQRVTELLERWLGEGECLPQTAPWVRPIPTTNKTIIGLVPVTTDAGGTIIIPANSKRVNIFIQNHGNVPVIIQLGSVPSITDYATILTASNGTRTGDGGWFDSERWKGSIIGIVEAETANISIFEEVVL